MHHPRVVGKSEVQNKPVIRDLYVWGLFDQDQAPIVFQRSEGETRQASDGEKQAYLYSGLSWRGGQLATDVCVCAHVGLMLSPASYC